MSIMNYNYNYIMYATVFFAFQPLNSNYCFDFCSLFTIFFSVALLWRNSFSCEVNEDHFCV